MRFSSYELSSPTRPKVSTVSVTPRASPFSDHRREGKAAAGAGHSKLSQQIIAAKYKVTGTDTRKVNHAQARKVKFNAARARAPNAPMYPKKEKAVIVDIITSSSSGSDNASSTPDSEATIGCFDSDDASPRDQSEHQSAVEFSTPSTHIQGGKAIRNKGNEQLLHKTLKRVRGKSLPAATRTKRVKSMAQSRSALCASSTDIDATPSHYTDPTKPIFIIQLGPEGRPDCPTFRAHESVLCRSPILAFEIEKAKAKHRHTTKPNVLHLMAHNPTAFAQMLEFLHKDRFHLTTSPPKPAPRLKPAEHMHEILALFSLAKHYQLPELQKQAVQKFSQIRKEIKVTRAAFFCWAEEMYRNELDHEAGPFQAYFSRVAPIVLNGARGKSLSNLCGMARQGGRFGCELFKAALAAPKQAVELVDDTSSSEPSNFSSRSSPTSTCDSDSW